LDSSKQWRIGLIVAVALGILGSLVSLFTPYLTDKDKKLEFSYNISALLVSQQISGDSRLKISMDSVLVKHPRLVEITLKNTGKLPIDDTDFKSPVSVSFENNRVIGAATATSQPEGVLSTITLMSPLENGLHIKPGLMNIDDQISVSVLVDAEHPIKLNPKARIVGIKDIALKELNQTETIAIKKSAFGMGMASLGIVVCAYLAGFILSSMSTPRRSGLSNVLFFGLVFYGLLSSVAIQLSFLTATFRVEWIFAPQTIVVAIVATLFVSATFGFRKARLLQLKTW
jgi:hypothetical protein